MKRVLGLLLAGLVGAGTLFSGVGVAHAEEEIVTEETVTEDVVADEVTEQSNEVETEEVMEDSNEKITNEALEESTVIKNEDTNEAGGKTSKTENSETDELHDSDEKLNNAENFEEKVLSEVGLGGGVSDDYPVIIVPGIMGSRLYDSNGTKIWESPKAGKLDIKTNPTLFTKENHINQAAPYGENTREYGAGNKYKKLVDSLCDNFDYVYFFSYDWRQDNTSKAVNYDRTSLNDATASLYSEIQYVKDVTGKDKVNIVAHSMGGLVTASYIASDENNKNNINRIITCGTPYEGAPALLHRTLTDVTLDDWHDPILRAVGVTQAVKKNLPSISQLSPTSELYSFEPAWNLSKWVTNVEKRIVKRKSMPALGGGGAPTKEEDVMEIVQEIPVREKSKLDYNGFKNICKKIYGENFDSAEIFKNSIRDSAGFNELYYLDNTYFVVGINQATIISGSLETKDEKNYSLIEVEYDNIGDGTVPYHSATNLEKLSGKGKDNNGMKRYLQVSTDHGGTVSNEKAIDYIISVLRGINKNVESDKLNKRIFTKATIQCPVDVVIEKNGEVLSSADGKTKTSFGQIDYLGETGDIKSVYLEGGFDEDKYNISLNGAGGGMMDLTLSWYSKDGDKIEERQFLQIPITEKTVMTTDTYFHNVSKLNVDSDGDGTIDDTWYSWDGDVGYRIVEEAQENNTQPSEEQKQEEPTQEAAQPVAMEKKASASTAQPTSVVKASAVKSAAAATTASKTGDNNLTALWISLSVVSAGVIAAVIIVVRKRRAE